MEAQESLRRSIDRTPNFQVTWAAVRTIKSVKEVYAALAITPFAKRFIMPIFFIKMGKEGHPVEIKSTVQ